MNSFNTHEETTKLLRKYAAVNVKIHCFNQSVHPRIVKESLLPFPSIVEEKSNPEWYESVLYCVVLSFDYCKCCFLHVLCL